MDSIKRILIIIVAQTYICQANGKREKNLDLSFDTIILLRFGYSI